jgi:hypothetical protein
MSVLMLFLDGFGIGSDDPSVNPIAAGCAPFFSSLLNRGFGEPVSGEPDRPTASSRLDATLGVSGLPQSGTGQTTLFTGVNAAKLLGRHFGPYPHSLLHPLLRERNLFKALSGIGKSVCFANAFPDRFFEHLDAHPTRLSVTTLACTMSNVPLMRSGDLVAGRAVSADITGVAWPDLGHADVEPIPAEKAGDRLARLARENDFVLFEYWKTDHAGHAMDHQEACEVLRVFDLMLGGLVRSLDDTTVLLLTSDHGNIEDLGTKAHTLNPVPLVLHGKDHRRLLKIVRKHGGEDLSCVTPAIVEYLR